MTDSFPILVAEDDPNDVALLRRALAKTGLTGAVRFVSDGREAIEYLEGHGRYADRGEFPFPHVIITDLKMPRLNGLELLEWLSSHPECHIIPTILLSGSALDEDIVTAYKLGANTYFAKPTNAHDLIALVQSLKDYWSRSQVPVVEGAGVRIGGRV